VQRRVFAHGLAAPGPRPCSQQDFHNLDVGGKAWDTSDAPLVLALTTTCIQATRHPRACTATAAAAARDCVQQGPPTPKIGYVDHSAVRYQEAHNVSLPARTGRVQGALAAAVATGVVGVGPGLERLPARRLVARLPPGVKPRQRMPPATPPAAPLLSPPCPDSSCAVSSYY